ncbi:MAG: hypothetical protein JSR75_19810 [Proteobacteria bacterium]|nr:hypothetical protein [Pseudomonadota bacterium]
MTINADNLNRTKKLLLDTGEVTDVAELDKAFERYAVIVRFGAADVASREGELGLLTMLNTAARTLDGQVQVEGPVDVVLKTKGFEGTTLKQALTTFGAKPGYRAPSEVPLLSLTNADTVRPVAAGWRAAVVGCGSSMPFEPGVAEPLAVIAAAALAVNEAFHMLRRDHALAGKRVQGLSLWRPDVLDGWASADFDGPAGPSLPAPLWVLGLGNLGQAYLWTIAAQFSFQRKLELWLQDDDVVTDASWSTSVLTPKGVVKRRKARMLADAMDARGFETRAVEQRMLTKEQVTDETPRLVLFGVDNTAARRLVSDLSAMVLVEAGLGQAHDTFRGIRVHGFPQEQHSRDIWSAKAAKERPLAQAYQRLLDETKDICGTTTLASRSVGVPFVGCFAAALVVAELLRRLYGGRTMQVQDLNLRELADRECVLG